MTIEQLSGVRIIITMSQQDMGTFALEYENIIYEDKTFQKVLRRLLALAKERLDISLKNKTLLVEAMSRHGGCILLITLLPRRAHSGRRYRLKQDGEMMVFSFKKCDDMIDCLTQLYKNDLRFIKGEVFQSADSYDFIVSTGYSCTDRALGILSEYSTASSDNEIQIAHIREHSKLILSGFPVMKMGRVFA